MRPAPAYPARSRALSPARTVIRLALLLPALSAGVTAFAQGYPNKPVRLIAPFAAGSTIDIIGRIIAPKMHEALGQPVIVENRAGAGGMIGMDAVAKSAPDGHTIGIGALGPLAMNPVLYPKTPFDPVRDFAAVSLLATGPVVIAIHPSVPARTLQDLIALAHRQPGQLNFGSPGVGSSPHLTGELFKLITKSDIVHVPYKGNAEAITDLIGGQLTIVFTGVPPVVPLAKAGKVRLLATTGRERIVNLPEIPTIEQAGVKGASVLIWYGVVAPAATPKEILARLNQVIVSAMSQPDVREKFSQQAVDPAASSAAEFGQMISDEYARWGKVIRSAGIKLE